MASRNNYICITWVHRYRKFLINPVYRFISIFHMPISPLFRNIANDIFSNY